MLLLRFIGVHKSIDLELNIYSKYIQVVFVAGGATLPVAQGMAKETVPSLNSTAVPSTPAFLRAILTEESS